MLLHYTAYNDANTVSYVHIYYVTLLLIIEILDICFEMANNI